MALLLHVFNEADKLAYAEETSKSVLDDSEIARWEVWSRGSYGEGIACYVEVWA